MVERDTSTRAALAVAAVRGSAGDPPVLLTLLGEFVFPEGRPVWTSTYLSVLEALGYAEGAARQALSRSAAAGWLDQERVGRHSRLTLTTEMTRLLKQGSRRIYGFGLGGAGVERRVAAAPGHRARELVASCATACNTRLAWAGFGPLGQGVWVTPDPSRESRSRRCA